MEPDDAHSSASSSLSSLTPSPDPARSSSPLRKRPRLSSASPPSPAIPRSHGLPEPKGPLPTSTNAFEDLLDGLGDDDFRMLPSSDPAAAGHRSGGLPAIEDEPGEFAQDVGATTTADEADTSAGEGVADDSGLGLLADVEQDKGANGGEADALDAGEDVEFEGDDMWLEFDNAAVGFDQPDTFPSSALSLAPPKPNKGKAVEGRSSDETTSARQEEPRLSDFGFASLDPAASLTGGGFVFAMRKPLVLSDKALQRARALLEPEDADSTSTSGAGAAVPTRTTTPVAGSSSASGALRPSTTGLRAASPASDGLAVAPSAFAGFQNAAGRALEMPSEEALQRARERLDVPDTPGQTASERAKNPLRPLSRPSALARDVFEGSPAPARALAVSRPGSAFALAPPLPRPSVVTLPLPAPALAEAAGGCDSPTTRRSRPGSAASSAGRGSRPGSPKRAALLPVDGNAATVLGGQSADKGSLTTLHSSSPSGRAQSPPPPAAAPAASSSSTAIAAPRPVLAAPIPVRPAPPGRPVTFRPPMLASTSTPARPLNSTPLRPFAPSTSTAHSPFPAASSSSTPNPLLPQNRRLNLGMTPRNKPYHLANTLRGGTPGGSSSAAARGAKTGVKAFVTPFKGGKRPDGLTPLGLRDKVNAASTSTSSSTTPRLGQGAGAGKGKATEKAKVAQDAARRDRVKVFELDVPPVERHPLGNFGMRPQMHFYEAVEAVGVPREVLDMDSTSGLAYVFPCGRGVSDAFAALQAVVAARVPEEKDLVTLQWVKNHWKLILWKAASYVRSRPDLLDQWWTFERVLDQLRYRYEREVNRAERSAIKRIQERDSPASLPMVLCVSQIRWDDPPDDADTGTLVIVGLELTDGWYRIRTNVDQTLKRACERGKLVVGSKIAISGARLDSVSSEGVEVLQALNSSTLVISGNSTSLAPWHATLGFHREPFVAGLTSLSPGGGLVPLVDVVIDRVYACGYIDLRKGRGTETWGEEEERTRAEEWKRGRRRIEEKLSEEAEKAGTEEDEVVELLQEAASMLEVVGNDAAPQSTPPEEPDEILDRLEGASNKRAIVRSISARQVPSVLQLAVEKARESRFSAIEQLQKELADKYPPRDIRCFRMMRVSDAREGTKATTRSALLTVWDAQKYGEGFFDEGTRYLISNLVPKGSWRPQDREVALATRRDSGWRKVKVGSGV
ncbi:Rad51-associated protein Brh2 [Rhodotorula diobovata]|uniref:Rad51-associated protein Brh2 n=1 Tax=Rhodotorula diobovata TaxID=5288 RepID=A0A5C5FZ03_9BASI|nr:Rad51-associated protein Brh2 [Rhodotorula diobovata]